MTDRHPDDPYKCVCGRDLVYCPNCEQPAGRCPVHDADWIAKHKALEERKESP